MKRKKKLSTQLQCRSECGGSSLYLTSYIGANGTLWGGKGEGGVNCWWRDCTTMRTVDLVNFSFDDGRNQLNRQSGQETPSFDRQESVNNRWIPQRSE